MSFPSEATQKAMRSPEMQDLARKAGLVDAEQLFRFMNIEQLCADGKLVDITGWSDVELLQALFGDEPRTVVNEQNVLPPPTIRVD